MNTFNLGKVYLSANVRDLVGIEKALRLLAWHQSGDWGDLDDDDKRANEHALKVGERIFSAYQVGEHRVYVITEWDRSSTSIILAEDY